MKITNMIKILPLVFFSFFAHANINNIEPQTLLKLIQKKQAPLIIDVRTKNEFAQGHIQGAINIAYDHILENQLLNAYKDQKIILYCRSGRRATIANQLLQNKGFTKLENLDGSLLLWQQQHYPLFATN